MPISPEAIARFLAHKPAAPPSVKTMTDAELYALIKVRTGIAFQPATQPRQHQLASVAFGCCQEKMLLFVGVRMGKTRTTLYWKEHLQRAGLSKRGLIITPNPVLRPVWAREAELYTTLKMRIVGTDKQELLDALEEPNDLLVVSWSSLQQLCTVRRPRRDGKGNELVADKETLKLLSELFDFGAIDETHTAKNRDSLRFTIGAGIFPGMRWRAGLTGTPFNRDPMTLWAQAYLADDGKALSANYFFFREAFGELKPNWRQKNPYWRSRVANERMGYDLVFDQSKLPILAAKLDPLALVYENTEIKDQIEPAVVQLEMASEQRAAYVAAVTEARESQGEDGRPPAGIYSKLRMIASGYLPYSDDEEDNTNRRVLEFAVNPKMEWLASFLETVPEVRAIFVHMFTHTGNLICRTLAKQKISHGWLHGGIGPRAQNDAVSGFQTGKHQCLVMNAASGNAGLDLSMADYQCYVESPSSAIMRKQCDARALGVRQGTLIMDDLVTAKVELRVLDLVKEGRDLLASVVFDPNGLL